MRRLIIFSLLLIFIYSCQNFKSATKDNFQKRIQRVTPKDIEDHTKKILINEYQYEMEESDDGRSSIYMETSWKNVDVTKDEEEKNYSDVRVRFKVRSRETRSGPENTYNVHSLRFTAEVEAYRGSNEKSNWSRAELTPQRREYLESIYSDYKLEFDSGSMDFN